MPGPIIFVTTSRIREGKLDQFKQFIRGRAEATQVEKPGTAAFLAYLNVDESEAIVIQVFPDADAMDCQFEGVADRSRGAAEFLEFKERGVYGTPSDKVQGILRQAAAEGVPLHLVPQFLAGYLRAST